MKYFPRQLLILIIFAGQLLKSLSVGYIIAIYAERVKLCSHNCDLLFGEFVLPMQVFLLTVFQATIKLVAILHLFIMERIKFFSISKSREQQISTVHTFRHNALLSLLLFVKNISQNFSHKKC